MAKSVYSDGMKAKIIEAVVAARKAKKSWTEAHAAATEAGYKGGLNGVVKLVRSESIRTGKPMGIKFHKRKRGGMGAAPSAAAAPAPVKRGPGRPRKTMAPAGSVTGSIEAMVAQLVAARVRAVLDEAIAALKNLRG